MARMQVQEREEWFIYSFQHVISSTALGVQMGGSKFLLNVSGAQKRIRDLVFLGL